VANTCDGAWGSTRVRGQAVIVFSTSNAAIPTVTGLSRTGFNFVLQDLNGNAMPFGTSVTAALSGGTNCSIVEVFPATVPNGTNPSLHRVIITKGSDADDTCAAAQITFKAITPKGNPTLLGTVTIP
jgi:hypothetical protein